MHPKSWQDVRRRGLGVLGLLLSLLAAGPAAATTDLTAPVPSAGALFGSAVRISEDGKTVLVGAPNGAPCPGTAERTCGAVYVYSKSLAGWPLETTLVPADGGYPGFGGALALSPDATVALVGGASASCPDSATVPCGLLYVFVRGAGGWTQEKRIVDPFLSDQYQQGLSLALSEGGAAALVAGSKVCAFTPSGCGIGHVFTRDSGAWTLRYGFSPIAGPRDPFTVALSRDGTTALVGIPDTYDNCKLGDTPCTAMLFVYTIPTIPAGDNSPTFLVPSAQITTSSPSRSLGLGFSIGLSGDGDIAVAGNPEYRCADQPEGPGIFLCPAGFIFRRTGGAWAEEQRLPGTDAASNPPGFGARVALSLDGNTAVFEALSRQCSGCADLFVAQRPHGDWSGASLLASSLPGAIQPVSIQPLAISGDGKTVLLGTPWTSCAAGDDCGTVRIFEGISPGVALTVPTLNGAGLALLALLLAASGSLLLLRRRPRPAR